MKFKEEYNKDRCKTIRWVKKYEYALVCLFLFLIAFSLRVYRIGELPDIIYSDEAGVGYNAWCLANYGVDRYLNPWPIYPQNYDQGGQSPLYTYILVFLLKLFPASQLTTAFVRVPALIFSMLTIVCSIKLLAMIFENRRIALGGAALAVFCPYFIMSGRFGLDCNLMLGTGTLAITLLVCYIRKPSWPALLLCGGGFALVVYSYALSYIIVPAFLVLESLYLLYTKKISIGRLLVLASEICILVIPLILFVVCIVFKLPGFRIFGLHILPVAASRVSEIGRENFWKNFFDCVRMTLTYGAFPFDAVDKYYTMYVISIPFIAIGFLGSLIDFIKSIWKRYFTFSSIFVIYAVTITVTVGLACTFPGCVYQANAIFICYLLFCVTGIRMVWQFLCHYRKLFIAAVCVGYTIWIAAFLRYYFMLYSIADTYQYPFALYAVPEKEAFSYVMNEEEIKNIYFDVLQEEFYYFYYPISPYERKDGITFPGGKKNLFDTVNYNTPLEGGSAYLVRKENREFNTKIQLSDIPYRMEEFEYYNVYIID